ncbi:hypothetical protein As57867_022729, partial [Aphanomyces stellatus]
MSKIPQSQVTVSLCFGPPAALPHDLVHHAFEAHARATPDRRAIEFEHDWLTYGQLNDQANTLASSLASVVTAGASRVAVLMERCLEFPIGLLAAAKVGAAMMPLDATFPTSRLAFMLSDADARALITTDAYADRVAELELSIPVFFIRSQDLAAAPKSFVPTQMASRTDEAYIVYTSGSTGKPKGVPVLHQGAVNTMVHRSAESGFVAGARIMQFMAIGFDGFQWDLWKTLSNGATLVFRSDQHGLEIMFTVDAITCTPTALGLLGHPSQYPLLKAVSVAGEACPASLKDLWAPHVTSFMNLYGPSECAIMTHGQQLFTDSAITIGATIENVNCYILDDAQRPVPLGTMGEIYLGGVCVSPGYINLPDQTTERFMVDPFVQNKRDLMFRTGDMGKMLPNGTFEIMGRQDTQVKLKGYRIELEEVAEAMMQHPQVVSAAAIVKDKTHIVGYFTPATVNVHALQETVASHLPVYMIPAVWVGLDSMPQNVNGKIDKKALASLAVPVHVEALETELETRLAKVWAQVLGVKPAEIGRSTSFFALGGDSISATRLVAKAKTEGFLLTTSAVLKHPRLAHMVNAAKLMDDTTVLTTYDASISGDVPLTPIQHLNFNHPWKNIHFWNQSMILKARQPLVHDALMVSVAQLIARHDMLRGRFRYAAKTGWSQYVQPMSDAAEAVNLAFVAVAHLALLDDAVLAKERSLHLIDGPLYAVTVFELPTGDQYLHFAIHHTLVDLVSYRILADDLQLLLTRQPLGPKSMSFKEWSERLSTQALSWDASLWADYMTDDVAPPATSLSLKKIKASGVLKASITANIDAVDNIYGTNVQELALAALTAAFAELQDSQSIEGCQLPLMLEGHGREPWDTSIDISSTVGWFTSLYPIVFAATTNVSSLLRQVKQRIRAVPHGALSYGAIKYLTPLTDTTSAIKSHRHHNIAFNYAGRFQEMDAEDGLFERFRSADDVVGPDEADYIPGNIYLHHEGHDLVLDISVAEWQMSRGDVEEWIARWSDWMGRIVEHCLDPTTIGGRTLSDVPLLGSTDVVDAVEAELLSTLNLRPLDVEDIYPATPMQAGMLYAMIQDPQEYVLQSTFDLAGGLAFAQFQSYWKQLADQESLLRTVFVSTAHGLFQAVTKNDLSTWTMLPETWSIEDVAAKTKAFSQADCARGFTLGSNSYNRFTGIQLSDGSVRVIWTTHHAVMDGWSGALIVSRLKSLAYGYTLQHSHTTFKDYIEWLARQDKSAAASFWKAYLADVHHASSLGLAKPHPSTIQDAKYNKISLDNIRLPGLKAVSDALEVTASSVFQAAWAMVLHQYTRASYVKFGSVVSGRDIDLDGVESIVGVLTNTVPVLARISANTTVSDLILTLHANATELTAQSHSSLVDIKQWIQSESELFDTIFNFGNYSTAALDPKTSSSHSLSFHEGEEFMDSTVGIAVYPIQDHFRLDFSHKVRDVDRTVMTFLCERFVDALSKITNGDFLSTPVVELDESSKSERRLVESSIFGRHQPLEFNLLHHAFEDYARRQPHLRAVEYDDASLSYAELNAQASATAADLAALGVCVGSRVAVIMERCLELSIGFLSALKVGGAIMALDATMPANRLSFVLSDANAKAVVTTADHRERIQEMDLSIPVLYIDSDDLARSTKSFEPTANHVATSANEAYIVYTSGSTGKPKGVPVLHAAATNVMLNTASLSGISEGVRVLQFMAIGFDMCQWELWASLSFGATVVFRQGDVADCVSNVDVLMCTPTALGLLGEPTAFPNLKYVGVAGESVPTPLKDLWCPHVRFINCYGPAECYITHFVELTLESPVTVGKPIENIHCYVLDHEQRPVPVGVVGEIYLGGICVSPGYINLADETAKRFMRDPFASSSTGTMYRSGDLGRLLPTGNVEILGRQDSQVKLKGYRIELDEVSEAMLQHPHVVSAAAIVKDKTHLVGYFSPATVNLEELREIVASQLPVYMIPAVWVGLDELPQNANGKIDKKVLEAQDIVLQVDPLETDIEHQLAAVWADVLHVNVHEIGRNTSFFALGGDSLSVIKVVAACKKIGLHLTTGHLLKTLLLSRVAAGVTQKEAPVQSWPQACVPDAIANEVHQQWSASLQLTDYAVYPVTPLQGGMVYATVQDNKAYMHQSIMRLDATFDADKLVAAYETLAEHRDIVRTTFVTTTQGIYQVIRRDTLDLEVARVPAFTLHEFLYMDRARGFEIGDKYFVRLAIVETETEQHAVLSIHHALYDGWSFSMLMNDLFDAVHGHALVDRPSFCHVVDFIEAQDKADTETFWRTYLSGITSSPLGTSATKVEDLPSGELSLASAVPLTQLTRVAQKAGVTVAELAKLAWAATLRKYTRQNDVVFGQVMANRDIPVKHADRILGPMISTIPFRVQFDDTQPVQSLVDALSTQRASMLTHAHANLVDIKRWSQVEGDLLDTLFVFQNLPDSAPANDNDPIHVLPHVKSIHSMEYTFELIVEPTATSLNLQAMYKAGAISWQQAHWMLEEFDFTLGLLFNGLKASATVSTLWSLSPTQTKMVQGASFGTQVPLPFELVHHGFESQAAMQPHARALEFEDQWLSYGELNQQANVVAHDLAELGVCVGSRVTVIMGRCLEFSIGLVATSKAGAAVMPLDASFPAQRLAFVLTDANAAAIITTETHRARVEEMGLDIPVIYIKSSELKQSSATFKPSPKHIATRHDEAFIVYTSGSTGKPKGVPVLHGGAVNTITYTAPVAMITKGTRVMQFMALGFDACQWEHWTTFAAGATLVFRTDNLMEVISTIDVFMVTPTGLGLLGQPSTYPNLKCVCVAGEAIPTQLKDLWAPHVRFINVYGPSECAITTNFVELTVDTAVSVGAPFQNVNFYVLDVNQRFVPVGVAGEVYLGGGCISVGYINLQDQTEERFLVDPFTKEHGRMFRSGDLGRLLPNGTFEIMGRQDSQVKLKGYRIELDEVAEAIKQHPQVVSSAVIVKDKTHLVGYFTPATVDVEELKETVAAQLPTYMVPAVWVGLDVMPQNTNGKIDKKALQAMDIVIEIDALESDTEKQIAAIWSHVLNVEIDEIGRNSSFFALGGDSISVLKVVAACKKAGLGISASQMMKESILSRVAAAVSNATDITWPAVSVASHVVDALSQEWSQVLNLNEFVVYPVTPLQSGMIFATTNDREAYVFQTIMRVDAAFDAAKLQTAFTTLLERREMLRTTFVTSTFGIYQVIRADIADAPIETVHATSIQNFVTADLGRGFEIGDKYFIRLTMVTTDDTEQYCVMTIHHALYDGWSMALLLGDFFSLLHGETTLTLPDRPSFRTVVDYIEAQEKTSTEAYWRSYLLGVATSVVGANIAGHVPHDVDGPMKMTPTLSLGDITKAAQRSGSSIAELAKLAWAITLRKFTRQNDVVFGQVLANRDISVAHAERILGPLIATVPCRVQFDDALPVTTLIDSIQSQRGVLTSHSHASLVDIKRWAHVEGELYDTMFTFQSLPDMTVSDTDNLVQLVDNDNETGFCKDHAFELYVVPSSTTFSVQALYKPTTLSHHQARSMLDEFDCSLGQLCSALDAGQSVSSLWSLGAAQMELIHAASFGRQVPLQHELLHHAFEARVEMHPNARAVEFEDESLSYRELNTCANAVACDLARLGVCAGSRVAVIMGRSLEFTVGLLASLKAGGAMMPLDASFPAQRLAFVLTDANAAAIITAETHRARVEEMGLVNIPVIYIKSSDLKQSSATFTPAPKHIATRHNEAFIVYTSGSTGKPKGVPVFHGGAVNVVAGTAPQAKITQGTRVMQFMALGFDVCQWEVWTSLSSGATLVFRTDNLFQVLSTVDVLMCTPTGLSLVGQPSSYPNLKCVCVAGEGVPAQLKDLWAPHTTFNNGYGPSEGAILTHFVELTTDAPVTIGEPLQNVNCYILDADQRFVPAGVIGEVYLGGICVSPCYINLPDQTEERFLNDPFDNSGMMFRTGDLGRLLPNGRFEVLGRQDSQVKLKGYRIELDEVAEAIKLHPRIVSSAVIVKDKTHLVGYFTPANVDVEELKETVTAQLPTYMVPAIWVGLDSMPQNANGKIDKKALQALDVVIEVKALQTETEERLALVWSQVLDVDVSDVGRSTSFFALGGDSITAIRLVSKAKQAGLLLTTAKVMKAPTLESMARVATLMQTQNAAEAYAIVTGDVPLTPIQHFNFNHPWNNIHFWNLSMTHQPRRELHLNELKEAVSRLAAHHDMLRTRFHYTAESGWSQYVLDASVAPVVDLVPIRTFDDLEAAALAKERSLHLVEGPVYAVTVFVTPDNKQYLQFTLHHVIADMVSWRILLDDLQTALKQQTLAPKTMSFKAWSEQLTQQALKWDPAAWDAYMGDDVSPPADRSGETIVRNRALLNATSTSKLDAANVVYGTNIQELALAALTAAWGQLRSASTVEGQNLHLMMEGHGREPWDASLDVSSTVGWFTCEYPVVFAATSDVSQLVRQVKQKLRGLPNKGLSYGAIKYLVPESTATHRIKSHKRHNCSFNYMGRFQEMASTDSLFDAVDGVNVPQKDDNETDYFPGNIMLSHVDDTLALDMFVPDWLLSADESRQLGSLWCDWMERVVAHCLAPTTIGGRTLSDVPLLQSSAVIQDVEAELLATLALRPLDVDDIYPVTPLQNGILAATIRDSEEYVLQAMFDIRGAFTLAQLQAAWHTFALATPALRTVFVSTRHGMFQAVTKQDFTEWRVQAGGVWACEDLDALTKTWMDRDRREGFTLASKSFQRFTSVQLSDGRLRVLWTHHHALQDGWSAAIIMDKFLATCYGEVVDYTLAPFKDHVEWLAAQDPEPSRMFWKSALEHANKTLPLGLPKPTSHTDQEKYKSFSRLVTLPDMDAVCKHLGVTASTVFRAAWAMVLQQYTRSEHVIFGSVVSGRDTGLEGVEKMIGLLINTVPILAHVQATTRVSDLIESMHQYSTDLNQHSHCSLTEVKREVGISGEVELFDTMLVYENYPPSEFDPEAMSRPFTIDPVAGAEFMDTAVGVAIVPRGNEYFFLVTYKAQEVDVRVLTHLVDRFLHVASEIDSIKLPSLTAGALDSPVELENDLIQASYFGGNVDLPHELLHHAFEERAKANPTARAVEYENEWLTYGELNAHADSLACDLVEQGAAVGSRVAVIMERCLEFPIGLLAALKVGGAQMALDATLPAQRLAYMLADADVSAVVTTDLYRDLMTEMQLTIPVCYVTKSQAKLKAFKPHQLATRHDEAYIVYTSGSTGKPKGVPVTHAAAVNVMMFTAADALIHEGIRVMQFMAIGFDMCQWEVWASLSHGATVVFRGDDALQGISTVDVLMCTPTALSLLGKPSAFPNLKCVGVAGEGVPTYLKDLWAPHVRFINCYGPSECYITHFVELQLDTPVTIGRPLVNITCYVLDDNQNPVPVGVVGEIYLGGDCVSPGYINLADQTSERFTTDPFAPTGGRMYRSGDFGRLLPTGDFEILGRRDSQVKLKGYRIELDEVAEAMMQHPEIVSAAAIVKDKTHLVGYFTPANVNVEELQEAVVAQLPVYMVPAVWVGLDVMPQNANGKIDKKALQALDVVLEVDALQTDAEKLMASVWAEVLQVDECDIGRHTSFFALGGDSISVIKIVAALKKLELTMSAAQLLKESVLWRVASVVSKQSHEISWKSLTVPQDVVETVAHEWTATLDLNEYIVYPVTSLQAGMVYATVNDKEAYIMQTTMKLSDEVDMDRLADAFHTLVARHETLRTTFVTSSSGIYQVIRRDIDHLVVPTVCATNLNEFLKTDLARGFAIGDKYFVRFGTVVTADAQRFAVLTIHHALYDGWALSMVMEDFFQILEGKALVHRPNFRNVVDYIEAQDKVATETFWRSYLAGVESYPIGANNSSQIVDDNESELSIEPQVSLAELTQTAQRAGVSVAELAKLAWAATLRKYTRQDTVVFGQVLANRDIPVKDADKIIGPLLNTVPCRVQFDDAATLDSLVATIQSQRGSMMQHSHASLVDIKRWSQVEGELFDTLFVFQNLPDQTADDQGPIQMLEPDVPIIHSLAYAFELAVLPGSTSWKVHGLYKPNAISWKQARWMLDEFDHTLGLICDGLKTNATTSTLWSLSAEQTKMFLTGSSGPKVPLPFELLHHAYESRAKTHPHLRAVEFEDTWLSYKELNDQANALASHLTLTGVQPGSRVAVIMGRCLEFTIGLLAALKIGGVMVPVDATFPIQRISYMLSDANAAAIITTDAHVARLQELDSDIPVHSVSSEGLHQTPCNFKVSQEQIRNPTDEAYIVYTSGSTGKPKGVPVFHEGAVNAMMSSLSNAGFVEGARVMQFMAIGFDVCLWEIWKTLSMGATLVFRTEDLSKKIGTVDVLMCTPTALSLLGDPSAYPSLKTIFVGGEAIPSALKDIWCPFANVYNCYGPSECSITTHFGELTVNTRVDLGKPIENSTCYILDNAQRPVPIGVVGEMCLGGIGVCRGYINLPDQSAERFIADPFRAGGRMYRSGDLGRLLPNGRFEILGRQDTQVKLKGYRIELDEVAEAMMQHPGVIAAAA